MGHTHIRVFMIHVCVVLDPTSVCLQAALHQLTAEQQTRAHRPTSTETSV